MKKSIWCLSLVIVIFFSCRKDKAVDLKNLVYNSSFEQYSQCPYNETQLEYATGWHIVSGDADYYNACSSTPGWSVPPSSNYQLAATGRAFVGLIAYVKGNSTYEIIKTRLSFPLEMGTKYYVSFKANLDVSENLAINNLGIKFTTGSSPAIDNHAHIFANTVVNDTMNWVTISGSFIADSAYTHLFIGLFFDSVHTNILQLAPVGPSGMERAYYYIDDVCVSKNQTGCQ